MPSVALRSSADSVSTRRIARPAASTARKPAMHEKREAVAESKEAERQKLFPADRFFEFAPDKEDDSRHYLSGGLQPMISPAAMAQTISTATQCKP